MENHNKNNIVLNYKTLKKAYFAYIHPHDFSSNSNN